MAYNHYIAHILSCPLFISIWKCCYNIWFIACYLCYHSILYIYWGNKCLCNPSKAICTHNIYIFETLQIIHCCMLLTSQAIFRMLLSWAVGNFKLLRKVTLSCKYNVINAFRSNTLHNSHGLVNRYSSDSQLDKILFWGLRAMGLTLLCSF